MSRIFSHSEVEAHSTKDDMYLIVHGKVYNVTDFVDHHPGGKEKLLEAGTSDVTDQFESAAHSEDARGILNGMLIGKLEDLKERDVGQPKLLSSVQSSSHPSRTSWPYLVCGIFLLLTLGYYNGLIPPYTSKSERID